jgi:uncharacterized membrane protein YoaK (UPF0700 family)
MHTFLKDIRETILPDRDSPTGPLPPLLLALTVVTGLVDAFSYLVLGHVFVANMTGNVVFLAFALMGAPGFSIPASIAALTAFGLGAAIGGRVGVSLAREKARLLGTSTTVQSVFIAVSVVLAGLAGDSVSEGFRYALIVVLGVSMGIQNAVARQLAVPDLTTTVLTMTITGITADSSLAGGGGTRAGRRWLTVAAMFVGALVGAVFIVNAEKVYALALALVIAVVVTGTTRMLGSADRPWAAANP